jgi:hypothetical protein
MADMEELRALVERLTRENEQEKEKNRVQEELIKNLEQREAAHAEFDKLVDGIVPEEDIGVTHLKNLKQLADTMNGRVKALLEESPKYDKVVVLVAFWEKNISDRPHIVTYATELAEMFYRLYGFKVVPCPMENEFNLSAEMNTVLAQISKLEEDNLFILYYGGHGTVTKGGSAVWHATETKGSVYLDWSTAQNPLHRANCDILFLFDCCNALAMVETMPKFKRRCEILGASGLVEPAGGYTHTSFTRALFFLLQSYTSPPAIAVFHVYSQLSNKTTWIDYGLKLEATPVHKNFSSTKDYLSTLRLYSLRQGIPATPVGTGEPRVDSRAASVQSLRNMKNITTARMLVALRFENPADKPLPEEFEDWVRARPHNIGSIEFIVEEESKVEAGYDSDSGLVLMSLPLWLWSCLPDNRAYKSVGVVRSGNLLKHVAELQQSAATGEVKPPPTPPAPEIEVVRKKRDRYYSDLLTRWDKNADAIASVPIPEFSVMNRLVEGLGPPRSGEILGT